MALAFWLTGSRGTPHSCLVGTGREVQTVRTAVLTVSVDCLPSLAVFATLNPASGSGLSFTDICLRVLENVGLPCDRPKIVSISPQGCLHAALVTSSQAHMLLVSVDLTAAEALPGFEGVVDASAFANFINRPAPDEQAGAGAVAATAEAPLAWDGAGPALVSYCGQPILLVLGESAAVATAAARAINLTYAPVLGPARSAAVKEPFPGAAKLKLSSMNVCNAGS